jgi:hypothetical protein
LNGCPFGGFAAALPGEARCLESPAKMPMMDSQKTESFHYGNCEVNDAAKWVPLRVVLIS